MSKEPEKANPGEKRCRSKMDAPLTGHVMKCELKPGHNGWHQYTVVMTWEKGRKA